MMQRDWAIITAPSVPPKELLELTLFLSRKLLQATTDFPPLLIINTRHSHHIKLLCSTTLFIYIYIYDIIEIARRERKVWPRKSGRHPQADFPPTQHLSTAIRESPFPSSTANLFWRRMMARSLRMMMR